MVFKHEIEIMTGGGAAPAPHCFFRRTLRSKNIFFLTELSTQQLLFLICSQLRVPCSLLIVH
jgi:hypothetical protein